MDGGGGTHSVGNWNDGRECINKNEGDWRGRQGMGNNGRGWLMTAGCG